MQRVCKKNKEQELKEAQTEQALDRSRGGFSTKIHDAVMRLATPFVCFLQEDKLMKFSKLKY